MKNEVYSGTRLHHLRLWDCSNTWYIYFTRHQTLCRLELCASWAVSGSGKKRRFLNWIFSFEKNFSMEINKSCFYCYMLRALNQRRLPERHNYNNGISFWKAVFFCSGRQIWVQSELTAMVKHDDHAVTCYEDGGSYWPWCDHGKIMSWSSWNIAGSWHGRHGKKHDYTMVRYFLMQNMLNEPIRDYPKDVH